MNSKDALPVDGSDGDAIDKAAVGANLSEGRPSQKGRAQFDRQSRFLEAFASLGTITGAAKASGVHRDTVWTWGRDDAQGFRARLDDARARFTDHLEGIMLDRIEEPGAGRGSDVLLMFALNANNPAKYRPNVVVQDDSARELLNSLRAGGRKKIRMRELEVEIEGQGETGTEIKGLDIENGK